jgi:glutathione-specific gamma-glutamylcyclotransferase
MSQGPEETLNGNLDRFFPLLPRGDLWVFGYGSLMWAPEFRFAERRTGHLYGYHRSLCIFSHRHRGTPERPGLVMGLSPGGSCWGVAFRVAASRVRSTLQLLWHREMVNRVYEPRIVMVRFGRRSVRALAFVADQRHRQYAGRLSVAQTARLVAQGCGLRGQNLDYLAHTVAHMDELGLPEGHLHEVLARTRKLCRLA